MTSINISTKGKAWYFHLRFRLLELGLWSAAAALLLYYGEMYWSHFFAAVLAVSAFAYMAGILITLGARIKGIARIPDNNRNIASLLLALVLTLLIWIVGVIGGSLLHRGVWELPWVDIISPGVLIGTFLGVATLFALIITFVEVREHSRPQAMGFDKALDAVCDFMIEFGEKKHAHFALCSYYPCIGAVTQSAYQKYYDEFVLKLKEFPLECVSLPFTSEPITCAGDLTAVSERVLNHRPASIVEVVGAFSHMWSSDSTIDHVDLDRFSKAMADIKHEVDYLKGRKQLTFVASVPDFHFLLALKANGHPLAGFVLIPLRPAGAPPPNGGDNQIPPMIGMEVHDYEILIHLHHLFNDLKTKGGHAIPLATGALTAPPISK